MDWLHLLAVQGTLKRTKEQKKKEQKTIDESKNKDYVKDHTKIQTDELL